MKWFTPFKGLCYLDVEDEIDDTLNHVSIKGVNKFWDQKITNDTEIDDGLLPYIVRLTLQDFDEFHSDTQAGFYKKMITIFETSKLQGKSRYSVTCLDQALIKTILRTLTFVLVPL